MNETECDTKLMKSKNEMKLQFIAYEPPENFLLYRLTDES